MRVGIALTSIVLVACKSDGDDQNNNNVNNNPNFIEYFIESSTYDASSGEIHLVGVMRPGGWFTRCELGPSEVIHVFRFGQTGAITWVEATPISDAEFDVRSQSASQLVDTTIPGMGSLRIIASSRCCDNNVMVEEYPLSCADIVYGGEQWSGPWPERPFLFCGACQDVRCGDGVCDPREYGSCTADCGPVCTGTCGDGVTSCGEECDDANNVSGDGCDANCFLE